MRPFRILLKSFGRNARVRALASRLAAGYIRLVFRTGRWDHDGLDIPAGFVERGRPVIGAFWHSRLLMMVHAWTFDRPFFMLISRHRDGALIAEAIGRLGIGVVSGSTRKSGASAFRELLRMLRAGTSIGITPDGPRGPRMRIDPGVILLARLSGAPIIPATYSVRRRLLIDSWDRFLLPLPFSRGVLLCGEPVLVPRDAGAAELEALRLDLERRLIDLTAEADRRMGHAAVEPAEVAVTKPGDSPTIGSAA